MHRERHSPQLAGVDVEHGVGDAVHTVIGLRGWCVGSEEVVRVLADGVASIHSLREEPSRIANRGDAGLAILIAEHAILNGGTTDGQKSGAAGQHEGIKEESGAAGPHEGLAGRLTLAASFQEAQARRTHVEVEERQLVCMPLISLVCAGMAAGRR